MTTISSEFTIPCTQDRAILIIQDLANSLQWSISELTPARVVMKGPRSYTFGRSALAPMVVAELREVGQETVVLIYASLFNGSKKQLTGLVGRLVNGVSVRAQTQSIAINPTVSIGEGQGEAQPTLNDRIGQLERLQNLFDSGALSREEFESEKRRVLDQE